MAAMVAEESGLVLVCGSCGQRNRVPFSGVGHTAVCGKCEAEIPAPGTPVEITTVAEFDALVAQSPVPVLVDFWAPWCGPCRMMAPEMDKVAAARAGRLVVAKVDTEQVPQLAERYGIYSIPTIGVFADGRPVAGAAGARPAKAIEAFVDEAMRSAGH